MTKSAKKNKSTNAILAFFGRHPILKHLVLAMLFLFSILLLTLLWLNIYTNHGQKIAMPDLEGLNYKKAKSMLEKKTFEMIVSDSIFVIGEKGGMILKQNPEAGDEVKENRKVYVTVTKYNADKIKVSKLPILYGNDYSQKKTELEYRGIKSEIKDRKYDPGEPNHILEVYYNGELIIDRNDVASDVEIEKGGTLAFVISDRGGGEIKIPSLQCMAMAEAEFILEQSKLSVGEVLEKGEISDRLSAFVLAQNPPADGSTKLAMGSSVNLTIVQEKPEQCN